MLCQVLILGYCWGERIRGVMMSVMPRAARASVGGVCWHVLNRGNAPATCSVGTATLPRFSYSWPTRRNACRCASSLTACWDIPLFWRGRPWAGGLTRCAWLCVSARGAPCFARLGDNPGDENKRISASFQLVRRLLHLMRRPLAQIADRIPSASRRSQLEKTELAIDEANEHER